MKSKLLDWSGNVKTVVTFPWNVDEYEELIRQSGEQDLVQQNAFLFSAINLRCKKLTAIPYKFFDLSNNEINEPENLRLKNLIEQIEYNLLTSGHSIVVKLKNLYNENIGLQVLDSKSVQVDLEAGRLKFRSVDGSQSWNQEDVIYLTQNATKYNYLGTASTAVI